MGINRLLWIAVSSLMFAACAGGQQGVTPVAGVSRTAGATQTLQTAGARGHSAGHLVVTGGPRSNKGCPSAFLACVTISSYQSAQIYFCYTTRSYCGPSLPQYYWYWGFINRQGKAVPWFNGSIDPNPGNPATDTISEAQPVKSTHGKYKYAQRVCPHVSSTCVGPFYIGIAVK